MKKQDEKNQAAEAVQSDLSNLSPAELIAMIEKLKAGQGKDRKAEILGLIKEGHDTSQALAEQAGITTKNVASILTALRKEGHFILTMKIGGQNIIKLLTEDEAEKLGMM